MTLANAPDAEIDVTDLVTNPDNVLLVAPGAAIIFIQREALIYEVHTAFLKPDRESQSTDGPYIQRVCLAAYFWMFTHTLCMELLTYIPGHNRAATIFAPLVGWVKEFERKGIWLTVDKGLVDLVFFSIRYEDWVRKTPRLMESGKWFHRLLVEYKTRHGITEPPHPDEDCHDLYVGACVETLFGDQPEKAVILYNRWARFAGYGLIALKARTPLLVDIGDALIQVADGGFKVVKCR